LRVGRLLAPGDLSVLQGQFELGRALSLGEGEGSLTHTEVGLSVACVVLKDAFALIDDLIVVLLVELAESKVGAASDLSINTLLRGGKVCVKADCVDSSEVQGAGLLIALGLELCASLGLELLSLVKVNLLVSG